MTRSEIINAVENNQIVYSYTNNGCELVLSANRTELFLSATGWVRWDKARDFKFRMLSRRATKFIVDEIETAAEDSALVAEYATGAEDWMARNIGPDADDDWVWEYED